MPDSLDTIFKAYDVRGVYPTEIDEAIAHRIGNAFVAFTGASTVVVGHDMRPSSIPLSRAFIEGAILAGADVIDIGLASTDMVYFASGLLDAPAAQFTASHNPAQYNGIKMCRASAGPIGEDTGLVQIKEAVAGGLVERAEEPGRVSQRGLLDEFADHVRSFIQEPEKLRPLVVVADTANGMGGLVVPAVFEKLPFDLTILYVELDGTFPNHPADPIQPENLVDLQRAVLKHGADIGLAFDGDADRVFVVDNNADPVSGSLTTAMVAKSILQASGPGEKVVHNLICSKSVAEIVTEMGCEPIRSRVGHSFIKQVMSETGAIFGGEHSGHYYFRDNWRADSGLIAAVVILEELSRANAPLSELRTPFERYAASGEINSTVADPKAVIERVSELFAEQFVDAKQDRLDGLTVDLGDWWFNLRASNTEPLLRLNLEAADDLACEERTGQVLAIIREQT